MQIAISTGACYPFISGKLAQARLLSKFSGEVNGIEVIFPRPLDLIGFNPAGRTAKLLQNFGFVSIHYPFPGHVALSKIPEKRLASKLFAIHQKIGLKNVIFHPGSAKNWDNFSGRGFLPLIENQCPGENHEFQSPAAMKRLLAETGLKMCFDVNHALGNGINPKEFLPLGPKIREVHVNYSREGREEHQFASSSKKGAGIVRKVLRSLPNAVWTIEPKSVAAPGKKIAREIAFLKSI